MGNAAFFNLMSSVEDPITWPKLEKSLEPLLATPTTDDELLLGKSLATFLPTLGVTYIGTAIFVTIMGHLVIH